MYAVPSKPFVLPSISRSFYSFCTTCPSYCPVPSLPSFLATTPQNNFTLLPNSSNPTNGPIAPAPLLPHPCVLTQIPVVTPLHAQNSFTQTNPRSHPAVAAQRTGAGFVPLQLNCAASKHTPLPPDSRAQVQVDVPLLLHRRRKSQLESHALEVQTPLVQDLPTAQALLQAPQWSLEVRRSWQPPLQSATPLPPQMGVGVAEGDVVLEEEVDVARVDDSLELELVEELEESVVDEETVLEDERVLKLVLLLEEEGVVLLLDDEEVPVLLEEEVDVARVDDSLELKLVEELEESVVDEETVLEDERVLELVLLLEEEGVVLLLDDEEVPVLLEEEVEVARVDDSLELELVEELEESVVDEETVLEDERVLELVLLLEEEGVVMPLDDEEVPVLLEEEVAEVLLGNDVVSVLDEELLVPVLLDERLDAVLLEEDTVSVLLKEFVVLVLLLEGLVVPVLLERVLETELLLLDAEELDKLSVVLVGHGGPVVRVFVNVAVTNLVVVCTVSAMLRNRYGWFLPWRDK
jgi:hypothetical protein